MTRSLRLALLTHSTNPRGGVVHALALGEALADLGHDAAVHAPDARGAGFFRPTRCRAISVSASAFSGGAVEMVVARIKDYARHFAATAPDFDIFHAGDGISGNALADLKADGKIAGFARTVHHIDDFSDPRLAALQERSIVEADELFVVSELWRSEIRKRFDRDATLVGNGVDGELFTPQRDGRESALRQRFGLGQGPVFLTVGGVEERKNSIWLLEAFIELRAILPTAQLVIAGGASLLDHSACRAAFDARLRASALPSNAVILTGPLDQADMPALFRSCDVFVFPSLKEGFGLVVLEAMACGAPVVLSSLRPFTDYLRENEAVWCDPTSPSNIAGAMVSALAPALRARLAQTGAAAARRHDWLQVARSCLPAYARLLERAYA